MEQLEKATEGQSMVIWVIVATIVILFALGGVLWWYDGYLLRG